MDRSRDLGCRGIALAGLSPDPRRVEARSKPASRLLASLVRVFWVFMVVCPWRRAVRRGPACVRCRHSGRDAPDDLGIEHGILGDAWVDMLAPLAASGRSDRDPHDTGERSLPTLAPSYRPVACRENGTHRFPRCALLPDRE